MKKIISMIVIFTMILSMSAVSFAATVDQDYIVDTENSLVKILTSEGWDYIASEYNTYKNYTVEVLADIEATKQFVQFYGTLVGKLDGVEGKKPTITNKIGSGLIGTLYTGTVKDLIINGEITSTTDYQGALANAIGNNAKAIDVTVSGIENNCSVSLDGKTGAGLIGRVIYKASRSAGAEYNIKVIDCVNNAAMSASTNYAGGIIGCLNGGNNALDGDIVKIQNCDNYGIISSNCYLGGIVGGGNKTYTTSSVVIENCANYGLVSGDSSAKGAGGIVGFINSTTSAPMTKIDKCANYGEVTTKNESAGGITGFAYSVEISKSFNVGNISAKTSASGIIGKTNGYSIIINDVYNKGNVSTTADYAYGITGFSVGNAKSVVLKNVYNTGVISVGVEDNAHNYVLCPSLTVSSDCDVLVENLYYLKGLDSRTTNVTYTIGEEETTVSPSVLETDATFGFEKLPEELSGDVWVSLEGDYPVLCDNLPTAANGTPITYHEVTLVAGENGAVSKDAKTLVPENGVYTLTVAPVEGYEVDEVANLILMEENKYQTEVITGDMTASVTFKEIELPQEEGIAGATNVFYSDVFEFEGQQVDSYNIVHFARFTVKDGVNAIYGIEISEDNFETVLNQGIANSNYNGQYGVRFYGTKIIKGNTYYLRPYVSYDNGETYSYGNIITYTTPNQN